MARDLRLGVGAVLVKWSDLPGPTFAMFRLWTGRADLVRRARRDAAAVHVGGVPRVRGRRGVFAADIGLGFTAVKLTTVADVALIGALAPVVIVLLSSVG